MFTDVIATIIFIAVAAMLVFLVIHYMRKEAELGEMRKDLDRREAKLHEQRSDLERRTLEFKSDMANSQHCYITLMVDDPHGDAPDFPDDKTFKSMKSKMGYYVVPKFRDHIKAERFDGKIRYSLDLIATPCRKYHK